MTAVLRELAELVRKCVVWTGKRIWPQCYKYRRAVLLAVLMLVFGGLILEHAKEFYYERCERKITFLMGKEGFSNEIDAKAIKKEVEKSNTAVGTRFSVELRGTDGFEDNRSQISQDTLGQFVGFAYDGFGESENVTTILPLDERYIHILFRKEFIEGLSKRAERESQREELDDDSESPGETREKYLELWERVGRRSSQRRLKGRVFLGIKDTAARQCAEIVLRHLRLDPNELECPWINDIREGGAALKRGEIDIAFFGGPFNSKRIREIARDGECVLVGLNGYRDAIVQDNPQLLSVDFQRHSYVAGDFCPAELEAIGARRVLICSEKMEPEDAYAMGIAARKALGDTLPRIARQDLPPQAERKGKETSKSYDLHPAAILIRDGKEQPKPWPYRVFFFLAIFLAYTLVEFAHWLEERGTGEKDDATPSAGRKRSTKKTTTRAKTKVVRKSGPPRAGTRPS